VILRIVKQFADIQQIAQSDAEKNRAAGS